MAVTQTSSQQHVAVLAFPFGSHALTTFNLMLKLAAAAPNLQFSFFSTNKSNQSLISTSKTYLPDNVKLYDVEDGLPPKNYKLTGNPRHAVELFMKAAPANFWKGIDAAVAATGLKISCLLTDGFLTFSGEISEALQVPWFLSFVAMPYNVSAHIYTDVIRQVCINNKSRVSGIEDQTLDVIPGLSMMRISDLSDEILSGDREESIFSSVLSKLGSVLPKASVVVMNFYRELYSAQLMDDLNCKLPGLLNLGFLTQPVPPPPLPPSDWDKTGCLEWLDRQKVKSVAYIAFGTVATPPQDEIIALAEALEEVNIPFIWSLRDDKKEQLPKKFLRRTSELGKIVPRAPQIQVLGHSSIGVFVTHFGANSVCESIANGVPMIGRPLFGDHRMNGRMVEEVWGIGMTVEGLEFTKNKVAKSLKVVFGDERGKKMRENVEGLKEIIMKAAGPDGSATQDLNTLVRKLNNLK